MTAVSPPLTITTIRLAADQLAADQLDQTIRQWSEGPTIIDIEPGAPVRAMTTILRHCDGAAAVVASGDLATLLRRGGHRGPIVGSHAEAVAIAQSWTPDRTPIIADNRLSTGADQRRWTNHDSKPWPIEEVRRRLEATLPVVPASWDDYIAAHGKRFERTMALVPSAPPGGRALDASAFPLSVHLLGQLGYWVAGTLFAEQGEATAAPAGGIWIDANMDAEVWFDAERHRLPCDDSMFDLVLAGEIIEHMPADPSQMLVEFNRVLRYGGLLVLTTPNIISRHSIAQALNGLHPFNYPLFDRTGSMDRHHQEFTPKMLESMVRRAGFHIELLTSEDVWFPDEPNVTDLINDGGFSGDLRGDSLFVVARKVSAVVDRTPVGVYTGDEPSWDLSYRVHPRRGVPR